MRPLDTEAMPDEPQPPRIGLGAFLLAIGGLVGWAIASLGGGATTITTTTLANVGEAAPADEIVTRDQRPAPNVTWTPATAAPRIPRDQDYAGTSNVIEFDDTLFVLFNLRDPATGETGTEIWQSSDGVEWFGEQLDIGTPFTGHHLAVFGDSLLISGHSRREVMILRSIPGRAIGGSSWTSVSLADSGKITPKNVLTAVSAEGELVTVMTGEFDISRRVIDPLLPPGVDLADPRYVFREDGVLFLTSTDDGVASAEVIPFLSEPPEVVVTDEAVWIRLVTVEDGEILQTVPVPRGAYPIRSETPLTDIQLLQAWVSTGGVDFLPVTRSRALPPGRFVPQPWDTGFVAANPPPEDMPGIQDRVRFFSSNSGRAWRLDRAQPPSACGGFSAAIGAGRIHLRGDDGTQCLREVDTEWEVLPETLDAAAVVGGDAGFVAYPKSFDYNEGMFSRDGVNWTEIEIPGLAPYPTLAVLDDRIVAISVDRPRPNGPVEIGVWVGVLSSQ